MISIMASGGFSGIFARMTNTMAAPPIA